MKDFFENIDINQGIKCVGKPPFENFNKKNKDKILWEKISKLIQRISQNPYYGKRLHGNLRNISTRKFSHQRVEYRIAFKSEPIMIGKMKNQIQTKITFIMVGVREGFFDRLRTYVNSLKTGL